MLGFYVLRLFIRRREFLEADIAGKEVFRFVMRDQLPVRMEFLVALGALVPPDLVVIIHVYLQVSLLGETLRALIANERVLRMTFVHMTKKALKRFELLPAFYANQIS